MMIKFYTNANKFAESHRYIVEKNGHKKVTSKFLRDYYLHIAGTYVPGSGFIRINLSRIFFANSHPMLSFNPSNESVESCVIKEIVQTIIHESLHSAIIESGFKWSLENNDEHELMVELMMRKVT